MKHQFAVSMLNLIDVFILRASIMLSSNRLAQRYECDVRIVVSAVVDCVNAKRNDSLPSGRFLYSFVFRHN